MATREKFEEMYLKRFRENRTVIKDSSKPTETTVESIVSEKASEYLYRVLDRQINKARGLLTYNGLLLASFNFVTRTQANPPPSKPVLVVAGAGGALALLSCLPLLVLMVVKWGDPAWYKDAESDCKATLQTVWQRTGWVRLSLGLSLVATLAALWLAVGFLSKLLF